MGRFTTWTQRRACAKHGHLWVPPPQSHTFEQCIHTPCKRCDAWRTIHGSDCPDGMNNRTTLEGIE